MKSERLKKEAEKREKGELNTNNLSFFLRSLFSSKSKHQTIYLYIDYV